MKNNTINIQIGVVVMKMYTVAQPGAVGMGMLTGFLSIDSV